MTRLLVEVEGETEEAFVNEILSLELYRIGYTQVSARKMGKNRQRIQRGGVRPWSEVRAAILSHLRRDAEVFVGVMVDYYGMPQSGDAAWPGRAGASAQLQYPNRIEELLSSDISNAMGGNFNPRRFIPYVMMHEFEAMLFSDCNGLARSIGNPDNAVALQAIRDRFASPEDINDSPETAPSKRLAALISEYRKPEQGIDAVQEIGIDVIRGQCRHFREWLQYLENIAN